MQSLIAILPILQIVLSILLVSVILLQKSEAGLGSAFGGNTANNPFTAKRGFEKTLFIITIILAILFVLSTLVALFV